MLGPSAVCLPIEVYLYVPAVCVGWSPWEDDVVVMDLCRAVCLR